MDLVITVLIFLLIFSLSGLFVSVRPPRIYSSITPAAIEIAHEPVTLRTSDGLALSAWWIPQPRSDRVVIGLHGYPADKGDILPALLFLLEGYNLLLIDFRYFGESEGNYTTVGAREVRDLEAGVVFAKSRGFEKIGVWGFSLGGAVALMTASESGDIRAVVAEASYAELSWMARESFRHLWVLKYPLAYLTEVWARLFLGVKVSGVSPAGMIRGSRLPVLLIHSRADRVIPFHHAERLKEALSGNPNAEFWFQDGLVHGELGGEYTMRVTTFFNQHLR